LKAEKKNSTNQSLPNHN